MAPAGDHHPVAVWPRRRRVSVAVGLIGITLALSAWAVVLMGQQLRARTAASEINEGLWGPFELERQLLLTELCLARHVGAGWEPDRTSGCAVADWQLARDLVLARLQVLDDLQRDNPSFDAAQRQLLAQLRTALAPLATLEHPPRGAAAARLADTLAAQRQQAHALINARRLTANLARQQVMRDVQVLSLAMGAQLLSLAGVSLGLYWQLGRAQREAQRAWQQEQALLLLRERTRLARDMHDGLGHALTCLVLQAERLRSAPPRGAAQDDALAQLSQLARRAQQEAQRAVHALQERQLQAVLDDLPALLAPLQVQIALRGAPTWLDVARDAALARVIQEATTNIRKHADASAVQIDLWLTPQGGARLRVQDNGRGWDGRLPERQGTGLRSMAARLQALGGTLSIKSHAGGGVTLEATLPPGQAVAEEEDHARSDGR